MSPSSKTGQLRVEIPVTGYGVPAHPPRLVILVLMGRDAKVSQTIQRLCSHLGDLAGTEPALVTPKRVETTVLTSFIGYRRSVPLASTPPAARRRRGGGQCIPPLLVHGCCLVGLKQETAGLDKIH